jgi:hypothetical protein
MNFIGPLALIVAALVAMSGLIISKKPDLKATFDKIMPYQGFLGVGLLAWGIYDLLRVMLFSYGGSGKSLFSIVMLFDKFAGIVMIGYLISEILLGFMLGFGLIAGWIPGEGAAEKKGVAIQKKLLGLSVPIGVVGMICAILWLIKSRGL